MTEISTPPASLDGAAARRFAGAVRALLGDRPTRVELWDGSSAGDRDGEVIVLRLRSRRALDRLIGASAERAFGRAHSEGLIEVEPLEGFLEAMARQNGGGKLAAAPALLNLIRASLALGARPELRPTPGAESRLRGRRHSPQRDAAAIRHHYDLPEAFYALWLDASLTYSCGYFASATDSLGEAQRAKLELVCRKLRLRPGERLLDVGCGWGSLAIHAADHHGVEVVGITLSPAQAEAARRRVEERGLGSRVVIRLGDYRDPLGEPFDAVASIGMVEHVGRRRMDDFGGALHGCLRPEGRLLLHGITRRGSPRDRTGAFIDSFVFPDGELQPIGWRDARIEAAGFELRDGESLREHYALTLGHWVDRLRERWQEAVRLVGEERARVWLLYLTGSKVAFRLGTVSVHQSLFVRSGPGGGSGLPLRRSDWYAERELEARLSGR